MSLKYKGWIPCVLGNLSFKLLGLSAYPFPFLTKVKENDDGSLNLYCLQSRIPADYQLPIPLPKSLYLKLCSRIARKYLKENIESIFLLKASGTIEPETNSIQKITGRVYIFTKDFDKFSEQRSIFKKLSSFEFESESESEEAFEKWLENNNAFSCNIDLNRQGICEFEATSANASTFSESHSENVATIQDLVSQCFFFIKDAFHTHKHHNNTEDTLVSVTKCDGSDQLWADNTVKSIYRYVLNQRKLFNKNSMGIFSYIRTFIRIMKKNKIPEQNMLIERTVALEELERSIEVEIEQRESDLTFRRWLVGISLLIFQTCTFYLYKIYESNNHLNDFLEKYSSFIIPFTLSAIAFSRGSPLSVILIFIL